MTTVEAQVRDVRARMRRAAGFGAAVRGAFYGALLAGGWLVVAKLFGWTRGPLWAAAALPVFTGVAAIARRFELRHAAALLDRALGLEERVATALEGPRGPFGAAVSTDAVRALDPSRVAGVGRFRWPSEARFLVPALAFVALLAYVPDPSRSPAVADADLRAAVDRDVDRLSRVPVADAALAEKVKKLLGDLRSDDLQRMAAGAEAARRLAVEIRSGLATAGGDREALRALADRLDAAGAGASSELARRGIDVPDVAPVDLEARVAAAKARGDLGSTGSRPEDRPVTRWPDGTAVPIDVRKDIEHQLAAKPVDPRYDEIVRRYFERLR
ncbi:MAG TPA: hypothetical protein VFC90_10825 [Planctomycetota bacterium]|nr:hypothetical protein [Planctomycetota bacterium]